MQSNPILNNCSSVTLPFVRIMALGGVLIGKRNAAEVLNAMGANTKTGDCPCRGATQAKAGKNILAAATLDIMFVIAQDVMLPINITQDNDVGPYLLNH